MTEKKTVLHELKALDFLLDSPADSMSPDSRPWHPIEEMPRDGRTVEVICPDDRVYVVALIGGSIRGDADYPGAPLFWRERA